MWKTPRAVVDNTIIATARTSSPVFGTSVCTVVELFDTTVEVVLLTAGAAKEAVEEDDGADDADDAATDEPDCTVLFFR